MAKRFPSFCLALLICSAGWATSLSIKRVVDGDTVVLSDGRKVRLIGVDTPEVFSSAKLKKDAARSHHDTRTIQALGARASRFLKTLMTGRVVHLEYDQHNKMKNHLDRYGRTLAYIYFDPPPCDEIEQDLAEQICELDSYEKGFLNALIVEAGYGHAYTSYPFRYSKDFLQLEREAREMKRGLWKVPGEMTEREKRPTDQEAYAADRRESAEPTNAGDRERVKTSREDDDPEHKSPSGGIDRTAWSFVR